MRLDSQQPRRFARMWREHRIGLQFSRTGGEDVQRVGVDDQGLCVVDQRSEEHTSELQSLMRISYAVFCLKKKNNSHDNNASIDTTSRPHHDTTPQYAYQTQTQQNI